MMQPPLVVVQPEQQRADELVPLPALCQRKPATTQSAVRACFTLIIARLPGWYVPSAGFAITPSRPAPSNRDSHSDAWTRSRVIGVRWIGGLASASSRSRRTRRSLLGDVAQVLPVDGDRVERDERGRRLLRELGDARGGRMQSHLQRVEVEPARRGDHDLAVDHAAVGQTGEQGVVQLGKVAVERPQVAALDEHLFAPRKTIARNPSHFGSYRKPSPTGSSVASFASIGSIGGAIANGCVGMCTA